MKQMAFTLLLLTVSTCLFAACNKRPEQPINPGVSATASPTVMPLVLSSTPAPGQAATPAPASMPGPARATANKSGWWIRIHTNLTTAPTITFQIGTSKAQREEWRVWRTGEPTEFDVPANYLQAPQLYLRGNVSPIGKIADLCLMYKDHGVEHMDFNDDDSGTKRQTQMDFKCR